MKLKLILFWGLLLTASCKMLNPTTDIKDNTPSETSNDPSSTVPSVNRELNEGLLDDIELDYMSYRTAPVDYQNFIVLYSMQSGDDILKNEVVQVLDKCRINYELVEIADFAADITNILSNMNSQDALINTSQYLFDLANDQRNTLIEFIRDGGNAVFLINSIGEDPFLDSVGIVENSMNWIFDIDDLDLNDNIFPGYEERGINSDSFFNSVSWNISLTADCNVIAQDSSGIPLIWTREYGDHGGKILYTNSTCFQSKSFRGLLLQCLSLIPDYFLSTQYNSALFYIDDFPVSIPGDEIDADLLSPYDGMKKIDFINHVWWPDIKNLKESYNLKLTAMAVGNYINGTDEETLYEFTDEDRENFTYHATLLKEVGAELGIHGFNHASLVLDSEFPAEAVSIKWPSISAMVRGLNELKRMMDDLFNFIPYYSYVPPMNRLSNSGKAALLDVFPQISNVAAVFEGIEENGDLIQEIEEDPFYSHWIDIPRYSAGYLQSEENKWLIYDALACSGVFSHFIHPDDAMDPVRNEGYSWDSMYTQFDSTLNEIFSDFPYLNRMSSAQMAKRTRAQEGMDVYSWKVENRIRIRYSEGATPVYHYLRIQPEQSIQSVEGGSVKALQSSSGLYLLIGNARDVTVNLQS